MENDLLMAYLYGNTKAARDCGAGPCQLAEFADVCFINGSSLKPGNRLNRQFSCVCRVG